MISGCSTSLIHIIKCNINLASVCYILFTYLESTILIITFNIPWPFSHTKVFLYFKLSNTDFFLIQAEYKNLLPVTCIFLFYLCRCLKLKVYTTLSMFKQSYVMETVLYNFKKYKRRVKNRVTEIQKETDCSP